jgi:hypothetical protein
MAAEMWRLLQANQTEDGNFTGSSAGDEAEESLADQLAAEAAAAAAAAAAASLEVAQNVAAEMTETLGPGWALLLDIWPHVCTVLSLLGALYIVVATTLRNVRVLAPPCDPASCDLGGQIELKSVPGMCAFAGRGEFPSGDVLLDFSCVLWNDIDVGAEQHQVRTRQLAVVRASD